MKRITLVVGATLIFVMCGQLTAQNGSRDGWVIGEDCGPHPLESAFLQRLQKLNVGEPEYLPSPFPSTHKGIVKNFEHEFWRLWAEDPKKREVTVALKRGSVTYQILPITNWSKSRCLDDNRPFRNRKNYLIRLFDSRTGNEIARARANADGRIGVFGIGPFEASVLLSVDEAKVMAEAGLLGERRSTPLSGQYLEEGQLVKSHGSMACLDLQPCVAFKSESGVVLVERSRYGFRVALEEASRGRMAAIDGRQFGDLVRSGNERGAATQTTGASISEFRTLTSEAKERPAG